MRVKRFVAPTMQVAVAAVKEEFGPDAVILSTGKTYQPGLFGIFRRRWVAVTAGVYAEERSVQRMPASEAELPVQYKQLPHAAPAVETAGGAPVVVPTLPGTAGVPASTVKLTELTVTYLVEKMRQQDIAAGFLDEISEQLRARVEHGGEAPRLHLLRLLAAQMPVATAWKIGEKPLIVPLVGPTGVGKTTTIAKLATIYALLYGWKVGFITADTYRVAAVEQLRTYADILDVPMEVLYSPADVPAALERLSDKKLILMDTGGRSHYVAEHMAELRSMVAALPSCHPLLVVNAAIRYTDLEEVIDRFASIMPLAGLIVTKLDETRAYGCLYNAVRRSGKPIEFVTNGQSVPEDIQAADPLHLAGMLVGVES